MLAAFLLCVSFFWVALGREPRQAGSRQEHYQCCKLPAPVSPAHTLSFWVVTMLFLMSKVRQAELVPGRERFCPSLQTNKQTKNSWWTHSQTVAEPWGSVSQPNLFGEIQTVPHLTLFGEFETLSQKMLTGLKEKDPRLASGMHMHLQNTHV